MIEIFLHGHEAFRRTVAVRDRLMHPKAIEDLHVTDSETQDLQDGWHWYQNEMGKVLMDSKVAIEPRFAALLGQNPHPLKNSS